MGERPEKPGSEVADLAAYQARRRMVLQEYGEGEPLERVLDALFAQLDAVSDHVAQLTGQMGQTQLDVSHHVGRFAERLTGQIKELSARLTELEKRLGDR